MSDNPRLAEYLFEKEWRRCFPDWEQRPGETDEERIERMLEAFLYFCSKYWYIKHPSRRRILFELREAQQEVVEDWLRERFTLALKARQVGFSTLSGAFAFWLAYGWTDRSIVMVSRNEREASKLLSKSRYGYRFLPDWMKVYGRAPIVSMNTTKISMSNDSYIESLPSASDPARGESLFLIIVDEIGYLPNSEEAWASIEATTDIGGLGETDVLGGGRVVMLGTANGEGNLFHREWVKSRGSYGNGTGVFYGIFHSWRAVDERTDEWYANKAATTPEWQMAQEYPDNPDEAFLKSGRPVFDLEQLRNMSYECEDPERGYLALDENGKVEFVDGGGPLRIWRHPEQGHRYSMGVDVAEGLENGDYSSIHVIDAKDGMLVAHWHDHIDADLLGEEICYLLGHYFNQALAIVEANNHGGSTLHALRRKKYFPLYYRRRHEQRNHKKATEVMGWLTTPKSKGLAIDELNAAIREGDIDILDTDTIAELRVFVREGNGKMNGSNGSHDDRVMSLAIANQGLKHVHLKEYRVVEAPGPGTWGWAMKHYFKFDDDDPVEEERPMGYFNTRETNPTDELVNSFT